MSEVDHMNGTGTIEFKEKPNGEFEMEIVGFLNTARRASFTLRRWRWDTRRNRRYQRNRAADQGQNKEQ